MIKYPLTRSSWDDKEKEIAKTMIDIDRYTMGKHVKQFENDFNKFFNVKYSVMVNSGSSANLLAIASLFFSEKYNLKRGDEVIVPAVSWSTTYSPLQQYGLKVKFVDIDRETFNYDLSELESAITTKTRLIIAVNLLGNPNDFKKIEEIINGKDIVVMEDNCESMGARYNGIYTGSFGLIGTFSFFFSHHISTMEGGMVITDDEELYHILLSLRAHGWTRDLPKDNQICEKSDDSFFEKYRFILPGYNLRPLEISGAIGCEQLKKLPGLIKARRKNANYIQQLFTGSKSFTLQKEIGESSWFAFAIVIDTEHHRNRKKIVKTLEDNNIECRPIVAGNFLNSDVIRYYDYEIHGELKNTNTIHNHGFYVGNYGEDLTPQIENLAKILGV